jgi:hypothetical protein
MPAPLKSLLRILLGGLITSVIALLGGALRLHLLTGLSGAVPVRPRVALVLLAVASWSCTGPVAPDAPATAEPVGVGRDASAPPTLAAPQPSAPLSTPSPGSSPSAVAPSVTVAGPAVLVGAGGIASCDSSGDEATAALLDAIPGTVFTLGDNVYENGTADEFARCYGPSWGRHKARTRPAVGNHEYGNSGAAAYFEYFGQAAGERGKGYYSYQLGTWHILVLNSNCAQVGDCGADSSQVRWLRGDLMAHPTRCTLAYWHHPRFSSGPHGSSGELEPIWQALHEAGADVVLSGHDHIYERFAPQNRDGVADPDRGIRQFTVGTGGRSHYAIGQRIANSELVNADTFGVLKLTLGDSRYDWEFVPIAGQRFRDAGSAACH